MTFDKVSELAEGRVYTARQALKIGLIDEIGTLGDAIAAAKQAAGWSVATHPAVALIGVGLDNDYGHPYPGTVAAYQREGAVVGRTDLDGDVAVVVTGDGHLGVVRRGR